MRIGLHDACLIAHFLEDMFRMNYIYILHNKKQETVLRTIQDFYEYAKQRWGQNIKVLKTDGETSLGNKFDNWTVDKVIEVEQSPPYTQSQNGAIERSGGVLIRRATALRLSANLPEFLWPEIFIAAGYLVNRSPNRSLKWKTPIGALQEHFGVPNPKPNLAHLKAFGCRAYPHIQNAPKLDKTEPRAHIGYLVGYNSTNIFRI